MGCWERACMCGRYLEVGDEAAVLVDTLQHLQFEVLLFRPFSGNFYDFWQDLMGADTLPPKNPSTLGFYIKIFNLKYICLFL